MNCSKCSEPVTDYVLCNSCNGHLHFSCAGVAESTYRRMTSDKKSAWRCPSCRTSPSATGDTSNPTLASLLAEIRSLKSDLDIIKTDLRNANGGVIEIKQQLNEFDNRFTIIEQRVSLAENKISTLSKLETDLNNAYKTISELQDDNNKQDQFSRLNNVEISGIPDKKGENLHNIMHDLYQKVGLSFLESDIDSIHRVRRFAKDMPNTNGSDSRSTRPPAIIVRFVRRSSKDQLLAAARSRRGITTKDISIDGPPSNIYISDHLTPANKLLLKRARQLKGELNYTYLWVRDCKIFMRKNEKSKSFHINNDSILDRLK